MSSDSDMPNTSLPANERLVILEPTEVADSSGHARSSSPAAASVMATQGDRVEAFPVVATGEADLDKAPPFAVMLSPSPAGGTSEAAADLSSQPSVTRYIAGSVPAAYSETATPPGSSGVSVPAANDGKLPVSAGKAASQSEELPTHSSSHTQLRTADPEDESVERKQPGSAPCSSEAVMSVVAMAAIDPAPPAPPPADRGSSASDSDGEMAVPAPGALAMLAGYNSEEDGGSDGESSGPAEADGSSYVQLVNPAPASPTAGAPAVAAADGAGYVQLVDAPAGGSEDVSMDGPELVVDREGLYRDSLAAPWSEDSASDSDSSAESSGSSSDSDSEPAAEPEEKEEGDETDQVRRVFGPMTKGELCLLDLPPIEHLHIVLPEDQCTRVGAVTSVVDCLVVVQSTPGSPPLDIDSVLFLERGRRPLGRVYDVMGPVSQAAYCVRFNTPEEIEEFGVKPGADVYYAPGSSEYSHLVFVEALRRMRGSDASWWDCNEPPDGCLDFSDDEAERSHKRKNRKRPSSSSEPGDALPGGTERRAPRPERGRGRGQGRGRGDAPVRPPWMPAPPRNPFYGHRMPSMGSAPRWGPPSGPFSRPPPPPPPHGGFGQPPPPFSRAPPLGPPPAGGPANQRPPFGPPPVGGLANQPPFGPPPNQPPPPWSQPGFWGR